MLLFFHCITNISWLSRWLCFHIWQPQLPVHQFGLSDWNWMYFFSLEKWLLWENCSRFFHSWFIHVCRFVIVRTKCHVWTVSCTILITILQVLPTWHFIRQLKIKASKWTIMNCFCVGPWSCSIFRLVTALQVMDPRWLSAGCYSPWIVRFNILLNSRSHRVSICQFSVQRGEVVGCPSSG